MDTRLLLISNSTNAGEEYLAYPMGEIGKFLRGVKAVRFIPYAAVTFSYDEYEAKVQRRFDGLGIRVESLHRFTDPKGAVQSAEALVVGGGNTWCLLRKMQEFGLLPVVRTRVAAGMPYVGWSAGSNVACPTIKTTNDMPIVEPRGFEAFGLVPFQINPHYLDANPAGHAGETREDRIREFMVENPSVWVVGLREGTMLRKEGSDLQLIGGRAARIFRQGEPPREVNPGDDLRFLF